MISVEFFADDELTDELDRDPFGEGPLLPCHPFKAAFPFQHPVHSRTIFAVCELIDTTYSERFLLDFERSTNQSALCLLQSSVIKNWKDEADVLALGVRDPISILKMHRAGDLKTRSSLLASAAIDSSKYLLKRTHANRTHTIDMIIDFTDDMRCSFDALLTVATKHASRRGPRKMDHLDDLIDWCCTTLHPEKALPSNQDADNRDRKTRLLRFVEVSIRTCCLKALRSTYVDTPLWRDKAEDINQTIDFYLDWTDRALITRIRERLQVLGAVVSAVPGY